MRTLLLRKTLLSALVKSICRRMFWVAKTANFHLRLPLTVMSPCPISTRKFTKWCASTIYSWTPPQSYTVWMSLLDSRQAQLVSQRQWRKPFSNWPVLAGATLAYVRYTSRQFIRYQKVPLALDTISYQSVTTRQGATKRKRWNHYMEQLGPLSYVSKSPIQIYLLPLMLSGKSDSRTICTDMTHPPLLKWQRSYRSLLLANQNPSPMDKKLLALHNTLIAKRKLTLIMAAYLYKSSQFKMVI